MPLQILNCFPRPLWVVTSDTGTDRGGLLATWVQPVSLDDNHPTALLALAPHHFTTALVHRARRCGLHLLRRDQLELALHFCLRSGRDGDKLANIPLVPNTLATGPLNAPPTPPLLADCLARSVGIVARTFDAGDRHLFGVDLTETTSLGDETPLTDVEFFARISRADAETLRAARQEDLALLTPLQNAWRALPESLPRDV